MAMETQNRGVVYEGEPVRQETQEQIQREAHTGEMMAKGGVGFAMFAGVCTIVLAVLGLVNILPFYMACIAAVVVGAGFLFEGRAVGAFRATVDRLTEIRESRLSPQSIGGIAAIVLGILALVGNYPLVMLSVAVLALGTSLFIGGLGEGFGGTKVFLGLSSLVLGVLCLMGYMPLTLSLVGFLCLGTAALLSGSTKIITATRT